jgi:hypothetical protein
MEAEIVAHESESEAMAEYLASMATRAHSEAEAEAMVGAATATMLSARDRRALRRVLPHMVRGTAILTRVLRRSPSTRPAVRAVPSVVRLSARQLARQAAAGRPINRRLAAQVMALNTRRVLGNPRLCAAALRRNVQSARSVRGRSVSPYPAARRRRVRAYR